MDHISIKLDQQLLQAYLSTTYEVKYLSLKIKIGESNWNLEEFLVDNNVFSWAFISAYNPFSQKLPIEENEKRHAQLIQAVEKMELTFSQGFGVPSNENWTPEKSLFILGISKKEAIFLGKKMEQNAIVFGRLGGIPTLEVMPLPSKK